MCPGVPKIFSCHWHIKNTYFLPYWDIYWDYFNILMHKKHFKVITYESHIIISWYRGEALWEQLYNILCEDDIDAGMELGGQGLTKKKQLVAFWEVSDSSCFELIHSKCQTISASVTSMFTDMCLVIPPTSCRWNIKSPEEYFSTPDWIWGKQRR